MWVLPFLRKLFQLAAVQPTVFVYRIMSACMMISVTQTSWHSLFDKNMSAAVKARVRKLCLVGDNGVELYQTYSLRGSVVWRSQQHGKYHLKWKLHFSVHLSYRLFICLSSDFLWFFSYKILHEMLFVIMFWLFYKPSWLTGR